MAKILIIEDELGLVEFLRLELTLEGNDIDVAMTGAEALELARRAEYDAFLLDVMLPDIDGFEICRQLRGSSETPIIMLTARGATNDRVAGLDAGADDYLVKPFAIEELSARLRALYRRTPGRLLMAAGDMLLQFGNIRVNLEKHRVTQGDQVVELTLREFELLVHFLQHPNQIFTRDELLCQVWGFESPVDTNVVDVYVGYLRQKIDRDKRYLQTVRGIGYVFRDGSP